MTDTHSDLYASEDVDSETITRQREIYESKKMTVAHHENVQCNSTGEALRRSRLGVLGPACQVVEESGKSWN